MELRHLRYFIAVAEELHFGRAAERLAISQPPLSQQILALEAELEVRLFDRSRRQVKLTRAGTAFLAQARRILAATDEAVENARRADAEHAGLLRVAHIAGASLKLLPDAILRHRERYPDVKVVLQLIENAAGQPDVVRAGAVDLGVVRLPFAAEGVEVRELGSEPMLLAAPHGHRLARRREVTWADLRDEPFVWYPRQAAPDLYDEQRAYTTRRGLRMHVTAESGNFLTMLTYVSAGQGVCLVLKSAASIMPEGVSYVSMKQPMRVRTAIAYRPERKTELVSAFISTLRTSFRQITAA